MMIFSSGSTIFFILLLTKKRYECKCKTYTYYILFDRYYYENFNGILHTTNASNLCKLDSSNAKLCKFIYKLYQIDITFFIVIMMINIYHI